jgi:tetraacyldisaccharide-1-P 4'-kinase
MITFGKRWKPHPGLFWLSPIYLFFSRLHKAYMLATFKGFPKAPTIPLVVIGALKAGGSGKTSVTLALARVFSERGLKVAILAYHLRGGRGCGKGNGHGNGHGNGTGLGIRFGLEKKQDLVEVGEDADWRLYSDEAVMLKRMSQCRVFVTRNRARAWMALHSPEVAGAMPFDLILSDDGFQDPRLEGAFRVLLMAPGERPGVFNLLPAGSYRETGDNCRRADLILAGPSPGLPEPNPANSNGQETISWMKPHLRFWRVPIFPPEFDFQKTWIALGGMGDNASFLADLNRAAVRVVALVIEKNHTAFLTKRLEGCFRQYPEAGIICTCKDAIKLTCIKNLNLPIQVIDASIVFEEGLVEVVLAYRDRFLGGESQRAHLFGKRKLVHYPQYV